MFYTIEDILPTTKQVKLIGKKEFAIIAFNLQPKTFIVHVTTLSVDLSDEVHPLKKAQMAHLKADEASTKVLNKYTEFVDVFSPKLAAELSKHTRINNHAIKLVDDWQSLYGPIYSLSLMELETLKVYIKNNLANSFIRSSKSFTRAPIFFDKKLDKNLKFCIDYRSFNNLTIKNWYPLPLVGELLNWFGWAQCFTQINLINAYYQIKIKEGNKTKTAFRTRYSHFKYQVMLLAGLVY